MADDFAQAITTAYATDGAALDLGRGGRPSPTGSNERVTISCQVSDIEIVWQLAEDGPGTAIHVQVSLPEHEARRLDGQHQVMQESLRRLAALAESPT